MSEEGFLGRWSRRKRTARRGRPAAGVADAAGTAKPAPAEAGDETPPRRTGRMITDPIGTTVAEPEKTEAATDGTALAAAAPTGEAVDPTADLPPVEALDENSDYTGFLRDGVPEALKNAALRRLWRSSPLFAFRDGLDDYDEDYTLAEVVAEKVSSLYRRGQGIPGSEDEEAPSEGEEAGTERAPLAAGDDDAGAEAVSSATGEDNGEAAETTDDSHDSHDSDVAAPPGPREGPGKA